MNEGPLIAARLNALLEEAGLEALDAGTCEKFSAYLALLMRWNTHTNLTAIRDEEGILSRHFVESIACALSLPSDVKTLLDFGSGAGFPGIPIAICRPEIVVTLAESQGKKAAFLREAIRLLGIVASVHGGRAETLQEKFDCVALRAVDRMGEAIREGLRLVRAGGWCVVITSNAEWASMRGGFVGEQRPAVEDRPLRGTKSGLLVFARKM